MSRAIQFIIFISVFLIVFFLMHFYVFSRFSGFFGLKRNTYFFLVIILLSSSYPLATFLERTINGSLARVLYIFSSTWMGVLFLLFSSLLVYELIRLFVVIPKFYAGVGILLLVVLISLYALINASFVITKNVDVTLEGLKSDLKVVQLSDIHVGTVRKTKFLERIVFRTNELNPDVVFITGDLVDGSGPLHKGMFDALKELKAPAFFVIGNHEVYEGLDKVFELLSDTSIKVLRNEVVVFKDVRIVGVDYSESKAYLGNVLEKLDINKTKPAILLFHNPISLDAAANNGIDLQLSGHTHNGQLFPFSLLVKLVYKYSVGLHNYKDMQIYISPGTGTWGPPMRLGSRNEITVINLKSK